MSVNPESERKTHLLGCHSHSVSMQVLETNHPSVEPYNSWSKLSSNYIEILSWSEVISLTESRISMYTLKG